MRIYLAGPHLGPLHTNLWSWSPGCRCHAPRRRCHHVVVVAPRRRVWPQVLAGLLIIGGISKAYDAHLWLGILVTVLAAAITALGVYGMIIGAGQGRQS